ncbi:hypothetical protein HDV00_007524 [Rhizophlyctis rosea]|nr:hypothetical protein HDV00_007524 [Rhizophlyctis rosea]
MTRLTSILALFLTATSVLASSDPKAKAAMEEADKHIHFIKEAEVDSVVAEPGVKFIFFGARWCKYTQRFTPKWLKVQDEIEGDSYLSKNLVMRKVDCTERMKVHGSLCANIYDEHGGWPTVLHWVDGTPKGEYPDEDEVANLSNYIKTVVVKYNRAEEKKEAEEKKKQEQKAAAAPAPAPAPTQAPEAKQPVAFKAEDPTAESAAQSASTEQSTDSPDSSSTIAPLLVLILVGGVVGLAYTKYRSSQNKRGGAYTGSSSRYEGFSNRESLLLWDAGNAMDKVA